MRMTILNDDLLSAARGPINTAGLTHVDLSEVADRNNDEELKQMRTPKDKWRKSLSRSLEASTQKKVSLF